MAKSAHWARRVGVAVLVLMACLAIVMSVRPLRSAALRAAGHALVAEDSLVRADVVVVPEWAGAAGALEAADIVRSGVAGRVAVLSGPALPEEREFQRRGVPYEDYADTLTRQMRSLGVSNLERMPKPASGTEAEGEELADWCVKNQFRSIVVVSPPDHSRRVRRVLRRSMTRCAATVSVRATRYTVFDSEHWWESRDALRVGLVELEKLILDVLRHPLS